MKDNLQNIGIWGRRHYEFLMRNQEMTVCVMRLKGTLHEYLAQIDKNAQEMFDTIINRAAELEGVNEQLKEQDLMEWIRRMNSIRHRVEEFVLSDLIYQ